MAEFDETSETSLNPRQDSKIRKFFISAIVLLLAIICMIIIANMVFKSRSAEMFVAQNEVWKPGILAKVPPLQTFAMDPIQMSLNDPTGGNSAFVKVVMALAYNDPNNDGGEVAKSTPIDEELSRRKFEIRDTIIRLIGSKTFDDLNTPEKQMNFKKEIINSINSILINGVIQDVYLSEFNVMLAR